MITVPTDFKTAMQSPSKQVQGYITLSDGTSYTPTDKLVSLSFTATGDLLKSAMTELDVVLLGDYQDLVNKTFTAYYGVSIDGNFEYVEMGVFNIIKAEYTKDADTTKLTTYDNMVLFQKPYASVSDFPTTLQDFTAALCAGVGVHFANSDLYNGLLSMDVDYWVNIPDITYRDVLNQICEVSVTNARMTADGSLELVSVDNPTGETLDYGNLLTFTHSDKWGGVNSVVLSRQPQNDDIYEQDENDIEYPTTRNILNLSAFSPTYSENEA